MSTLDTDYQSMLVNGLLHNDSMQKENEREVTFHQCRPSILLRPKLFPDGNQWCALYGDNLQEGFAGFGDTPEKAMGDFDEKYRTQTLVGKDTPT